jgi:hypothetical protein
VIELSNAGPPRRRLRLASPTTRPPVYGQGERSELEGRDAPLWAIRRSHHHKAGTPTDLPQAQIGGVHGEVAA